MVRAFKSHTKIKKKVMQKSISFLFIFFYRFLVDVGPMLGAKILIKSMKNQVQNDIKTS